jgi:HK97 family phage portal protein
MGTWKLIRTKEYDALQTEIKGYFEQVEESNQYLAALQKQLANGLRLPNIVNIDREGIRRAYETSAPVMGVVNYIAENVGEVANYLELTRNGEAVEKHPVLDILRRPNDRFTLRKFLTAWAVNKLLFGDAWVYAPRKMGKDGGVNLYVIPSQRVAVKNGNPLFDGIELLGMASGTIINAENVFESFDYNLDDTSLFGTSKVAAAAYYLSVMEKGIQRQDKTLEEGGATHLITPKPDAIGSVMPKDRDEIEKLANGKGSIGKKRALQFPVEVHQLGSTPVDLSILESHKEAVTALCFVFRLPVDLYYGQAKYENAKEAKKTIYEQNAIPLANEFAEDLLHYLKLDKEGYQLKVNTDHIDVLKDSTSEVLDNLSKMHASLNEMREAYGYERIEEEWADKPILPLGVSFGNEFEDISEV